MIDAALDRLPPNARCDALRGAVQQLSEEVADRVEVGSPKKTSKTELQQRNGRGDGGSSQGSAAKKELQQCNEAVGRGWAPKLNFNNTKAAALLGRG